MATTFELFLIDEASKSSVVALGRRGSDTAIERLPIDATLKSLVDTGRRIGKAIAGNANLLTAEEVDLFGQALFSYIFRGNLLRLYQRLPQGPVSLQILSDRPEIREAPWEYLQTPDRKPSPSRERMIVRVHPTCGTDCPPPTKLKRVRVLFVSADPTDQVGVDWRDIEQVITRAFGGHMPDEVSIKVVEGATKEGLLAAIAGARFDVFHFFGHGTIFKNVGHLVLQDVRTRKSDFLSATDLAIALQGKGVRLAVLSACQTGAGDFADDFGTLATALITAGIPAVIANQFPIPIKSVSPFVGSIYRSLMSNGNIDDAVADGRAMLAVGIPGAATGKVEWGIPTLYRLPDAQQLFKVSA